VEGGDREGRESARATFIALSLGKRLMAWQEWVRVGGVIRRVGIWAAVATSSALCGSAVSPTEMIRSGGS
jgi:hypothetical protein